jgi:methionine-rich copper-binding protein CopC
MSLTHRIFSLMLALCLAFATGRQAVAHAVVVEASPAIEGSVAGPEVEITLRFNSRLDHRRSLLTLIGPDGAEHRLALSPDGAPDTLQAKATELAEGAYKLRWQVLAVDGHITRGDIPFHVTQP